MKKTLVLLFLIVGLVACEQQLDPAPDSNGEQILSATDNVGDDLVTKTANRLLPITGIKATESGPESMPEGAERSATSESAVSSIWFEPNAGAIWYESSTGKTHLMAMQLPGGESGIVYFESLGTGWKGATHITMDRYNFYVVWNNAIYQVPKKSPNTWTKIVQSNDKTITGIVGHPDGAKGFDFSRIWKNQFSGLYNYKNESYVYYGGNQNVSGLALFKLNVSAEPYYNCYNCYKVMPVNPFDFDYWIYDPNQPIQTDPWFGNTYIESTPHGSPGTGVTPKSAVGNPVTQSFFYSKPSILLGSPQIYEFKSLGKNKEPFSYITYTPFTAPLVVNNGYVWIMGKTVQRLMTLGSGRGQSNHNDIYDWSGIKLACADPTLVF